MINISSLNGTSSNVSLSSQNGKKLTYQGIADSSSSKRELLENFQKHHFELGPIYRYMPMDDAFWYVVEREKLDLDVEDALKRANINIPEGTKFTLAVAPMKHKIVVEGLDDENLKTNIENALNSTDIGDELYIHLYNALLKLFDPGPGTHHPQTSDEIELKYYIQTSINQYTGYNINDLKVDHKNRTFVNDKGEDVFDMYEKAVWKEYEYLKDRPYDPHGPQLTLGDVGTLIAMDREKMWEYIDKNLHGKTPDKILRIDYENGALLDIGTKNGYGKGQRKWIDNLDKTLSPIYYKNNTTINTDKSKDKVEISVQGYFKSEKFDDLIKEDDEVLDPKLRAMKMAIKQMKMQNITFKMVKGEKLNQDEMKFLKQDFPTLAKQAQMAQHFSQSFLQNNQNDPSAKILMLDRLNKLSKYDNIIPKMMMNALRKIEG